MTKAMKLILPIGVLALAVSLAWADSSSPLQPLSFLMGNWTAGANSGPLGSGKGTTTFALNLQGHVMIRTNHAEYPAKPDAPAVIHDDLMIIYSDGGSLRADYYDNEGHVIRYTVAIPAPGSAVFTSEAQKGAPRYRLTYKLSEQQELEGTFEASSPDKPEDYKPFLAWQMIHAR